MVFQNALLIYELFQPPLRELNYNTHYLTPALSPTYIWVTWIIIQILSILLSAKSTFKAIIDYTKIRNYISNRENTFTEYAVMVSRVIIHIMLGTVVVYLEWLTHI